MRNLLFAGLLSSAAVHAQVVTCPDYYPAEDVTLASTAADPKGNVRLLSSHLTFARLYAGELYGEQTLAPPADRKVKDGWNTPYSVQADRSNWLVCSYGNGDWGVGVVDRWEKLEVKAKECELQVRRKTSRIAATRYTATASCK